MEQISLPNLEKSEVDDLIELYKTIYQNVTTVVSAKTSEVDCTTNVIHTVWSQRNLERGVSRKISRSFLQKSGGQTCVEIATTDISHWALEAVTGSGQRRAIIQIINEKNSSNYFLEIWSGGKCTMVIDLTALDLHGAVHTEGAFNSFCWSYTEDKLLYIAEEKTPSSVPFYPQKLNDDVEDTAKSPVKRGEQFVYEDDWGETTDLSFSKRQPVIVEFDIYTKTINILKTVPSNISPGQVIWEPYGDGIVGVGFTNTPRRLGLWYCMNRKSHIFWLAKAREYKILSDESNAVHSPRFSPDKRYLVWMQRPLTGTTLDTQCIVKYDWITKEKTVVVDVVRNSIKTKNDKEFFGFYYYHSSQFYWSSDSKFLIISTPQKYRINTYAVDIESGEIRDIGPADESQSTIVLEVTKNDDILCNVSSFKQPSVLCSLHLPSAVCDPEDTFSWIPLTTSSSIIDENKIYNFAVHNAKENAETCFATYYGPKSNKHQSTPMVLYLHGGPHITVPSIFTPILHFFTKSGFGVVIAHFRGSAGMGQNFIDLLIGKLGSVDVDDCYSTVQSALKKFPWLDPRKVVLYGGSTGGFIATHLIAQYPNDFKAVATRNPIVDTYLRCFLTDITDWSFLENGFPFKGLVEVLDDPKIREKMIDVSPLKNIKNVKTPVLFLLGRRDARCHPGPALAYHRILKEMAVPTKLLFYEDNHHLLSIPVEMDSSINSIIWFKRCLKALN